LRRSIGRLVEFGHCGRASVDSEVKK